MGLKDFFIKRLVKKYVSTLYKNKINCDLIAIMKDYDYIVIYFSSKEEMVAKHGLIESIFKKLDVKNKWLLDRLNLFIGYDYIFNFFIDWDHTVESVNDFGYVVLYGEDNLLRRCSKNDTVEKRNRKRNS